MTGPPRDWVAWHAAYDNPDSSLSRRLEIVRARIAQALDALPPGPIRILSVCAGDGRDLIPVLATHHRGPDAAAVLVEVNERLAAAARAAAGPGVEVRQRDAGSTGAYADVLPVDLLLLCGIFGNVEEADIERTVAAVPALVSPGGFVIWTRGSFEVDLRPIIRRWFADAGLDEIAFDGAPEKYGVGLNRVRPGGPTAAGVASPPATLFRFV